jgi:glycerophosphoryl diester phosphodiesterase
MLEVEKFLSPETDDSKPYIVGHRGSPSTAPENTIASFTKAIEIGVDAIELDIHQTSDSVPVVIHDAALDRTTDGTGMVNSRDLRYVKGLDAGKWYSPSYAGERVPTLEEALAVICKRSIALVEVKHGSDFYAGIEENVVEAVSKRREWKKRTVFIAFDPSLLQRINELDNDLRTGLLILDPPEEYVEVIEDFGINSLFPRWEKLRNDSIRFIHGKGYSVHPWVMDTEDDMKRVMNMGADSLSSNNPGALSKVIAGFKNGGRQ